MWGCQDLNMAGKFSSFFKGFQGGTVFRNLRHKKIVSGLLALCIHIDSYLAYICAERHLPLLYDIVLKPH